MSFHTWNAYLEENHLTGDPTDYVAFVEAAGARRLDDIVAACMEGGSDVRPEIAKAILERANHVKANFLLSGYDVHDGLTLYAPQIIGKWKGKGPFDRNKHKLTINANLSADFRKELRHVKVRIVGFKVPVAYISLVTDRATGKTDGAITPGDDILIEGSRIKLLGLPQEDGTLEPGIGIFLVPTSGGAPINLPRFDDNTPSHILARVVSPLPSGVTFRLRIVTRFTHSNILLKTPRIIDFNNVLLHA
jgi:hypothetical protein